MATLKQQNKAWAVGREKSAVSGLKLMIANVNHMAEHRDWDSAAWFLNYTSGDRLIPNVFKRLIKERFKDQVTLVTKGAKHASGFEFKFKNKGDTAPAPNTYARIEAFSADNGSYSSVAFRELLGDIKPEKPPVEFDAKKRAKAIYKLMKDQNGNLAALINALRDEEKVDKATNPITDVIEGGKQNAA